MFKIANPVQVLTGIDQWLESVEELADGVLRGLAIEGFHFIVHESAQWTGNLTASWSLSVAYPLAVSETPFKTLPPAETGLPPFESALQKGSPAAVNAALVRARADGAAGLIRLGVPVFISTGVPYAAAVELDRHPSNSKAFLREVNKPSRMVDRAAGILRGKGEISEAVARQMAARSL